MRASPSRPPVQACCFADTVSEAAASGRKSERTQARLRAATCRLLEAVQPADLKVADICRAAGVAHGTFYVYFQDIRCLLADTLAAFVGFVQSTMLGAASGTGHERVRSTTATYVELFERNPGLMRCLVSRMDDFPEAMAAFQTLNREWTATVVDARLRRLARERRAEAPSREVPSREELLRRAYALGGMVDQYLIMLHFGRDEALAAVSRDRDAVIDTLSLIWERGMDP